MTKKKVKASSPLYKFIKIVLAIVVPMFLIMIIASASYVYYVFDKIKGPSQDNGKEDSGKSIIGELLAPGPERITIAAFGVDEDGARTDVIVIGTYDTKNGNIDVFSIPRDTFIRLDEATYATLKDKNYRTPREMKMNELHAYAGRKEWYKYVIPQLEKETGLPIDHYVKIDIKAFRQIVDAIGGVDFYVPRNMDYEDPYQNLYIHLKKGQQKLDGKQAEMLVRFRKGYSNGDIGRISMQQNFMKAVADQTIQKTNIFTFPDLIKAIYDNVETDISLEECIGYATKYLGGLDLGKLVLHTIPGDSKYVKGRSYYVTNEIMVNEFVNNILVENGKKKEVTKNEEEQNSNENNDKKRSIQVLNGGSVNGLATKVSKELKDKGYKVDGIDTFTGTRTSQTRIYVKEKGIGEQLKSEFMDGVVIVDESLVPPSYDMSIVIGKNQK